MPFSSTALDNDIEDIITTLRPQTVCDIGPGAGKYGQMVKRIAARGEFRSHVTAVEIDRTYVERFCLESLYDAVVIDDAVNLIKNPQLRFDLILIGDCIEHMR